MLINFKKRFKAFAIHFCISALLISVLLTIVVFRWFPNEFIYAGGITGLKIIVGVDLILGPVLTFLVFDTEKASLKFDLAFIFLLQLSCLAGGTWLMYKERPVAQVLADDGIHIFSQADLDIYKIEIETKPNEIHPQYLLLDLPQDWSQIPLLKTATEFMQEKPFAYRNDLYIHMGDVNQATFSERISEIQKRLAVQNKRTKNKEHSCVWIPVISNHNSGDACINHKKGIVLLSNKNIGY